MKPISAKMHGVLDYTIGVLLVASPWLFGFRTLSSVATDVMVITGVIVIALSLITSYPLGLVKAVPFPTHGVIETIGALFLLASPWLFGYMGFDAARNVALIVGIGWLGLVALTNYSVFQTKFHAH